MKTMSYRQVSDIAKTCKSRTELKVKSYIAYDTARVKGWLDDFFVRNVRYKWDFPTCEKEAGNYKSRSQFKLYNPYAYRVARVNGWLDLFF